MINRYGGLDDIKIICIWMIVSIHALNHGNILDILVPFSTGYYITYSYYALTFVANNVFVLISGYFLIKQEFKIKKLISLWLQVAFYTIAGFIFLILYRGVWLGKSILTVLKEGFPFLFPVSGGVYWFFSCYLLLYLISPLLNQIRNLKKSYQITLIAICLVVFSVIGPVMKILCGRNTFGVNGGQSLVSFILLYLIGGMLRLDFPHTNDLKSRWFVAVGLAFIALLPLSRYTIDHLTGRQTAFAELLYMNISLPVVIASVCFFLAALNWRHNVAWSQNIASLTGDIYMTHENYAWYPLLWAFVDYPSHWSSSGIENGLYFFATVTVIFAAGIGVGMARRWFFKKSKICTALSECIVHIYEKYI